MFGDGKARAAVVDADQIVAAALGIGERPCDRAGRRGCVRRRARRRSAGSCRLCRRELERREEHAGRRGARCTGGRAATRAPPSRAGAARCPTPARARAPAATPSCPADRLEDFRLAEVGNQQAERQRPRRWCRAVHVGAGATRRSTGPAICRSRTARPTVIRDAPNVRTSSASLGSRSPRFSRPD